MRKYKPINSSLRHVLLVNHSYLCHVHALKKLTTSIKQHAGRNNSGKCCFFSKGGGRKILHRIVDFKRIYYGLCAEVKCIEYDPGRSSFIALILYCNGFYSYIIAPFQLSAGNIVLSSINLPVSAIDIGCTNLLYNIPVGTLIHNLEVLPNTGGKLLRSAGSFGLLLRKENSLYAVVRMRSNERRYFNINVAATIGSVSNFEHRYVCLGKAGRSRWLNKRPIVRGVAMNPIDHPHGGDTSSGKVHSTPWSVPTKGKPTRHVKRNFLASF